MWKKWNFTAPYVGYISKNQGPYIETVLSQRKRKCRDQDIIRLFLGSRLSPIWRLPTLCGNFRNNDAIHMNSFLSLGMYNAIKGVKSLMKRISDDIAAKTCDILLILYLYCFLICPISKPSAPSGSGSWQEHPRSTKLGNPATLLFWHFWS